jgi:hypothetical protein
VGFRGKNAIGKDEFPFEDPWRHLVLATVLRRSFASVLYLRQQQPRRCGSLLACLAVVLNHLFF